MNSEDIHDIRIDERIRNWVFIPLIVVMFSVRIKYVFGYIFQVAVIRFYLNIIINNKKRPQAISSTKQANKKFDEHLLNKCKLLRRNAGILPAKSYYMRKCYLCNESNGILHKHDNDDSAN